ncbi:MAG TPA: DUF1259 domain-containing protein [Allosphingosinicella sp.]|jgi:hypothetical protein|nr:DUF1259 domain-containing protein [Allosphingosinicella sp.]
MLRQLKILTAALCLAMAGAAHAAPPDWTGIAQTIGRTGALLPRGAYRIDLPRADLSVTLDGVRLDPAFALGSFAAFDPMEDGSVLVSGDLVLTEREVGPVMARLVEGGIEITALHQHLLRAVPPVMYMHFMGRGGAVALAKTLRAALDLTGTPARTPEPPGAGDVLDVPAMDRELGAKGRAAGRLVQYLYRRPEAIRDRGMPIAAGTVLVFQPLGGARAATTGDFALLAGEVGPVVRALLANGIEVTAVHNHMLSEEPRVFYLHFWAVGDAAMLARKLRPAVDLIAHRP